MRLARFLVGTAALCGAPALTAQSVLHDGGAIVTSGGGPGGANLSAVQTRLGLSLTGHAVTIGNGMSAAEDVVVPAGGWRVTRFEFEAFQPGADPGVVPFDRVHVRVWNGVPGQAGSNIVFGDLATDRLAGVAFAYEHSIVKAHDLSRVNRAFFTANGFVGIALFVFALVDLLTQGVL